MINIPQRGKYGEIYVKCSWSPITYVMIPAMYARTYDDAEAYVHRHFSYSRARTNHLICHIKALFDMEACTSPQFAKTPLGQRRKNRIKTKIMDTLEEETMAILQEKARNAAIGGNQKTPISTRYVHRQLQKKGYEVSVNTAAKAIQRIKKQQPDAFVPVHHHNQHLVVIDALLNGVAP